MAKSNRQKYNFLAAFVSQLDQARDEGDDLAGQHAEVTGINDLTKEMERLSERLDNCDRWLAQLELALEELDDNGSEGSGEEPDEDDDGVYDDELDGVEPPLGGVRQPDRRVAPPMGGTSNGQGTGRGRVSAPTKERINRGTKS